MWNLKWLYKKKWKVDRLTYWFLIPWEWPGTVNYIVSKHGKSFMQTHNKVKEINIAISTSLPRLISLISLEFGICREFSRKPKEDLRLEKKWQTKETQNSANYQKQERTLSICFGLFQMFEWSKKKLSRLQWF